MPVSLLPFIFLPPLISAARLKVHFLLRGVSEVGIKGRQGGGAEEEEEGAKTAGGLEVKSRWK